MTETLGVAGDDNYRRRVVAYTYDSLYRLLREEAETYNRLGEILFARTVTYTYDVRGNRLKMNVVETNYDTAAETEYTVTYDYNDRDQLVEERREAGPVVACTYGDGRRYAQAAHSAQIAPREAGAAVAGYWLFVALLMTFAGFVAWPGPRRRRARRVATGKEGEGESTLYYILSGNPCGTGVGPAESRTSYRPEACATGSGIGSSSIGT